MAKHRAPRKLSFTAIALPLFLAILAVLSILNFSQIRQGGLDHAIPPSNSVPAQPSSTPSPTGVSVPSSTNEDVATTAPKNAGMQNPPAGNNSGVKPIAPPKTTIAPPLPLPTVETKPLLSLDNGVELNIPLLNLGITLAPLK